MPAKTIAKCLVFTACVFLVLTTSSFAFNPFLPEARKKNTPKKQQVKDKKQDTVRLKQSQFVFLGTAAGSYVVKDKKTGSVFLWKDGEKIGNCTIKKRRITCSKK